MGISRLVPVLALVALTGGCNTWSTANVKPSADQQLALAGQTSTAARTTEELTALAAEILVTAEDITDRPYRKLGDIEVSVNKTTIFHADPTRAQVDEKLREEAAKLGADAVILVRYGTVGISFMSWGTLEGRGRAVAFVE